MTGKADSLQHHPVFSSSSNDEGSWEEVQGSARGLVGHKKQLLATRGSDVIVAQGKELRMANLATEGASADNAARERSYVTLRSTHVQYTVSSIVLSPNGRFLAVSGGKQLSVVFLPRSDALSKSGDVECRSFSIDEYTFSGASPHDITQIRWNILGEGSNSLWILTSDGKLREYDIFQPNDPAQTLTFLPTTTGTSSKFSAIDPLSRFATSFSFGPTSSSSPWAPLTVNVLIANGDVFTMGPVLPLRTEASLEWLCSLKAFADEKIRRLRDASDRQNGSHLLERALMQSKWVDALVTQASYAMQSGSNQNSDDTLALHPPHLSPSGGPAPGAHRSLLRQGPVTFEPAPPEGDEEDVASDIIRLSLGEDTGKSGLNRSVGAMAIAWSSGRVDLCLEVDDFEPRWISSRDAVADVPSMPVVHSLQLAIPEDDLDFLSINAPLLSLDPHKEDIVYVQHSCGMDKINLDAIAESLLGLGGERAAPQLTRLVQSSEDGQSPIQGTAIHVDKAVRLLVAMSASRQTAFLEIEAVASVASKVKENPTTTSASSNPTALLGPSSRPLAKVERPAGPDKASLLLAQPVDFDKAISSSKSAVDLTSGLRRASTSGQALQTVSGEHLRLIADISAKIQSRIQAIRAASQIIERRLDLQVQELQRQIKVLKDSQAYVKMFDHKPQVDRAESLLRKQEALALRMDKILQSMPTAYRPQIADVEQRWFDELETLRTRLYGGGGIHGLGRTRGMVSRIESLEDQLAAVRPSLRSLQREEAHVSSPGGPLAQRQLRPFENALSYKSEEIRKLTRRFDALSSRLEQELDQAAV